MIKLRPYQEQSSYEVRKAVVKHKNVILCQPPGSGKTVISAEMLSRAINRGLRCIFLTDRREILRKSFQTFTQFGLQPHIVDANSKYLAKSNLYVAMVETLYRRAKAGWFPLHRMGLIVIDECHMGAFNKVIKEVKDAFIVGLTASPVSSSFKMNEVYKHIVIGETVPHLINQGFLVPSIDIGQGAYLEMKTRMGEFTPQSQRDAFNQHRIDEKAIELWEYHAKDRQSVFYNIDIEHNRDFAKKMEKRGYSVAVIDSKTSETDRDDLLIDYEKGNIQNICNVGIFTKGWDSPQTSCIVYNRATQSLAGFYQAIARGGRPFEGKDNFITIDMGNNFLRHGSFNDDIDWLYIYNNPDADIKEKVNRNIKLCPVCYAYVRDVWKKMCEVCRTPIVQSKLIKLASLMPDYLDKPVGDMSYPELREYAKYKGYKNGWVWVNQQNNMRKRGGQW